MRTLRLSLASLLFMGVAILGCGDNGQSGDAASAPDLALSEDAPPPLPSDLATSTLDADDGATTSDLSQSDQMSDGTAPDAEQPDSLIPGMPDLANPDLANRPCDNTQTSCGTVGKCVDCTNNPAGRACVNMVCGCNQASDCPSGAACDPNTHQCGTGCATNLKTDAGPVLLQCNSGCCDGAHCVPGTINNACGSNGGACVACGGGTPTCTAGACTATCSPKGMGGAACGPGFCCNANNMCAAVSNTACGFSGAACVDCTNSPNGAVCDPQKGTCGCSKNGDCPMGEICKGGLCGIACDANTPCMSGCCDSVRMICDTGTTSDQCALGKTICGTCVGNPKGSACLPGANGMPNTCGCNSALDCPANQACNTMTHSCSTSCDAKTACNGGCCSLGFGQMTGFCIPGTFKGACGDMGGVCANCGMLFSVNMAGAVCEAAAGGGFCGCNVDADCPKASTGCNQMTQTCNFTCSANSPCQSGCCSIPMGQTMGTCSMGNSKSACGAMGVCMDCSQSMSGHVCTGKLACGCNTFADCPMGMACNLGTNTCTATCTAFQLCNGGCCNRPNGMPTGTCDAGTGAMACGAMGNACVDCTMSFNGHVCVNGTCGCNSAADCRAGFACNMNNHLCETTCGDANHSACNGGCCNIAMGKMTGTCVPGTANSACGSGGMTCLACANATPTCQNGACTSACGGMGNGTCGGGNCCSANKCVAGNVQSACGFDGACDDCTKDPAGRKCELGLQKGPWFCGCDAVTDCPAADPKNAIAGSACDTMAQACGPDCGGANQSACNGGCCLVVNGAGLCQAGDVLTSCGNAGMCSDCSGGACMNNQTATCINNACGCCTPNNAACAANANCCSNIFTNMKCACVPLNQHCVNGDATSCCSAGGGTPQCGMNNQCCMPTMANCAANTDCCSGVCTNQHCQ